jgi:DNA end-binding protein Ku
MHGLLTHKVIPMAIHSTWKGFLKLSLISVPVRAYNAAVAGHGDIHFHQVHASCGNRIHYQKVCPKHGEVPKEELVSGYELAQGQFVLLEPEELEQVCTENDKAITIQAFIRPESLDTLYYSGRNFYLVPDGPAGQKPFAVLHRAMLEENRYAVAQVVFAGHEETVLLRPLRRLFLMTMLNYEAQVKKPSAFEDEVTTPKVSAEELKLARSLIGTFAVKGFDFSNCKDLYTERLTRLIDAKAAGKKIESPPREEEPVVINLMDALRKSLVRAPRRATGASGAKGAKAHREPRVPRKHSG